MSISRVGQQTWNLINLINFQVQCKTILSDSTKTLKDHCSDLKTSIKAYNKTYQRNADHRLTICDQHERGSWRSSLIGNCEIQNAISKCVYYTVALS